MRLISEMGSDDYWPEFKDSAGTRTVSVSALDEKAGLFRQFTVEPLSLNFLLDSAKGIALSSLLAHQQISSLFKGAQTFCDTFKISEFGRAGFRTVVLAKIGSDKSLVKEARSSFNPAVLESVESVLGGITDMAIAFDGDGPDKLQFHLRAGPYSSEEAAKHFDASIARQVDEAANFVADLDFFENNFSMSVRAVQWSKTPVEKAEKVLAKLGPIFGKSEA